MFGITTEYTVGSVEKVIDEGNKCQGRLNGLKHIKSLNAKISNTINTLKLKTFCFLSENYHYVLKVTFSLNFALENGIATIP